MLRETTETSAPHVERHTPYWWQFLLYSGIVVFSPGYIFESSVELFKKSIQAWDPHSDTWLSIAWPGGKDKDIYFFKFSR